MIDAKGTHRRRFEGQTALVTGAASGIGASIARRFHAEGARVALLDIDIERAEAMASELTDTVAVACDVADATSVRDAFRTVTEAIGAPAVVVNNAGIAGTRAEVERRSALLEERTVELLDKMARPNTPIDITRRLSDEDWNRVLQIHLNGTFFVTREALDRMVPAGSGSIVNIASICGIMGCIGAPAYSAAKAGIIGFTKSVAKEVAVNGIRINVVAPGFIDTSLSPVRSRTERALTIATTPLGRLGRPDEVAETVLFLSSDDGSFYTGAVLSPDGGYLDR